MTPLSRYINDSLCVLAAIFRRQGHCDMQLIQLSLGNRGRCVAHHTGCLLGLRECNYIPDRLGTQEQHYKPVQTQCQASVRRCTQLKGIQQEAELLPSLLQRNSQNLKNLLLKLRIVDSDTSTASLVSVEYNIVGIGADIQKVAAVKLRQVFFDR